MCKVISLTNGSKIDTDSFKQMSKHASELLSEYERDGFGLSVVTDTGVFTQRYVNPKSVNINLELTDLGFTKPSTNQLGTLGNITGGIMFHGRTSTNTKSLINTHPIVKHDWTLIHNGVVSDSGEKYSMLTTNDTEHCLERLVQGIDQLEAHISGYYALIAFDPTNTMHVIKDSIAKLHSAWIPEIESYIFATIPSLIEDLCEFMQWEYTAIEEVIDNVHLQFNTDGTLIYQTNINPKGSNDYADSKKSLSLGSNWSDEYFSGYDPAFKALDNTDEELFLDEVTKYADDSYVFINKNTRRQIKYKEFMELKEVEMLEDYTVIRSDGTVCSPSNYYTDELYQGAI